MSNGRGCHLFVRLCSFFSLFYLYINISARYISTHTLCVCVSYKIHQEPSHRLYSWWYGEEVIKRDSPPHPSPYKLSLSPYIHIRWQIQSMHARLLYIQYIQTKYQICIYMHCVYVHGRTSQSGSSTPLRTHTHTQSRAINTDATQSALE